MWQSRTLWLAGLTVMSLGPLGCVVEDTDDSAFVAQWRVAYVANGGAVSCEDAGTPTVRLQARNIRSGAMYTANFPCEATSGITDVLPVGDYEVELALLDNFTNPDGTKAGRPVSQITGGPWAVRRHGLTDLDPIEFQVQVFEIDWILVRNAPGGADALGDVRGGGGRHGGTGHPAGQRGPREVPLALQPTAAGSPRPSGWATTRTRYGC